MSLAAGTRLGPYEVVSLVGAGGMGEVYRARDPRLSRDVAVKVLPASASSDLDRRRRFEQEARAIGSLNHPNLLGVFDIGEHEGATYVVFELLEGETLRERLSHGPLPLKKAVDYALQITQGLAAAHEKSIVHRDLKPENLFVTHSGRVKILDFGLAKLRPELDQQARGTDTPTATAITDPGTVLGTVGYMSPEQVQGRPADHRSDIFSFGSVLYEMLSGKRAFHRDSAVETMNAILKEDPAQLSHADSSLPATLERILGRCLEKNPDQRFRSAHDLAFALEAVSGMSASGTGATAAAATPATPTRSWLIAATVAVVAFTLLAIVPRMRRESGAQSPTGASAPAIRIEKLTNRGDVGTAAISADGRYLAYSSWGGRGTTIWLRDIAERTESRLVAPADSVYSGWQQFSRDGQSIYYWATTKDAKENAIYKVPLIGGDPRLVHSGGDNLELSPDEKHVALSRRREGRWKLFVAAAGGEQETDLGQADPQTLHVWSPDSTQLLFSRETGSGFSLFVVKADGTAERKLADLPQAPASASWHPRGDGIAVAVYKDAYESARLFHVDATTGVTKPPGERLWRNPEFAWLPDGSALVVSAVEKGNKGLSHDALYKLSYPDGQIERFPADTHEYSGFRLAGDGSRLVSIQSTGRCDIVVSSDPQKGAFEKIASGTDVEYRMCWMPDDRLVYGSNDGGSYDLYVSDADGSNRKQLTFDGASDETQPAASADGRYVVFVSDRTGEQGLYRINPDGTGLRRLTPEPKPHLRDYDPWVTPDSQWVLYRHWDNGPSVWKVPIDGGTPTLVKGARPATPAGPVESAFGASASPDGRSLSFIYFTQDPKSLETSKMEVAVASPDGQILKRFPYWNTAWVAEDFRVQWSRDGKALYYQKPGGGDLWKQAVAGGPPTQITHFGGPFGYFDWSFDGKRLAVSRLSTASDAVLISHFH